MNVPMFVYYYTIYVEHEGKNISVSDNLTGTRHIDIRVRRNNRPQSGGGVAAGQAVVGPGNEAPQEQAPPPDSAAPAQTNRRLKITVAADEPKPKPKPKPDADAKYLDQMRAPSRRRSSRNNGC
jgi:hypothetical protein